MYNTTRSFFAVLLTSTILLSACTEPAGQQNSGIETPTLWSRLTGTASGPSNQPLVANNDADVDQTWWKHFNDPTLDSIIAEALKNNKTLQIAAARVEEARAGRLLAQSSLLPQINAEASAQRGNQGFATANKVVNISQADIAATWELDLFGGNQARTAEAKAIWQSAEASRQAVRVGLLAEVARTYFDMRNFERQVAIARENLDTQKKTLELIKVQKEGALASDFDVQRAAAQVSDTEALIPNLQTAYDTSLNRLNVLLGYAPGSKDAMLTAKAEMKPLDQHIVISAPAKVLAERPDVRAAERQFAASISARRAAVAELFPDISLTALFGAQSATPFSSTPWGVGASLVQPVLNFGRIESQIDAADARQKQAFLNYQQTVLQALENMENALSGYIHETTRNAALTAGVAQNRKATALAKEQYQNGYTGLLDLLVEQRNLLDAEANQAASDANLRKDLVNIYAAAGGGWKE
ncbi:MAG TPA: TolC family protein [Rickettsiales bacterium]|nr:TolC family protein [Rickettsiales bacterium]